MRVLVGCETSGVVRDAFRRLGHYAVSCDLLPTRARGPHIQADLFQVIAEHGPWDLLIAHPPCTYLTVAAAWCYYHPDDKALPMGERRPHPAYPDRRQQQDDAADFFLRIAECGVPRLCVENPVGVMSTRYRKPDQIIQPYEFGEDASKKTCLWLRGIDPLPVDPKNRCAGRFVTSANGNQLERWANQTDSGQNRLPPSADRWVTRSNTYPNIARTMAEFWGGRVTGVEAALHAAGEATDRLAEVLGGI